MAGRINHDTLRDGWVLKFPSPAAGPADWSNPAVLFGEVWGTVRMATESHESPAEPERPMTLHWHEATGCT